MLSHSGHHRSTSAHPYYRADDPQRSTSTLASSTGETKKTFLGRWRSVFKKEAMEVLPEQDILSSSFLLTTPPLTRPPATPPIQHDPLLPLTQQTWQGTLYDSAWEQQAQEAPQPMSNLPAVILGLSELRPHQPVPRSSLTFSGITSTFLHCLLPPLTQSLSNNRSRSQLPCHHTLG